MRRWHLVLVLSSWCALAQPASANPVRQSDWEAMLERPGRYLREPNAETRRAFVRTVGSGYMTVYLQTPDTLELVVRNLESFVPLLLSAQTPPFHPDPDVQTWFRAVAPRRRDVMVRALAGWLKPASDSVAPYGGWLPDLRDPIERRLRLVGSQCLAAHLLADWDARELLPRVRALRTQLGDEASTLGGRALGALVQLDDAIRRLEGLPALAPVTPDGRGGFRSRYANETPIAHLHRWNQPSQAGERILREEAKALWGMVMAARETLFVGHGETGVEFQFHPGAELRLALGRHWGRAVPGAGVPCHPTPRASRALLPGAGSHGRAFATGLRHGCHVQSEVPLRARQGHGRPGQRLGGGPLSVLERQCCPAICHSIPSRSNTWKSSASELADLARESPLR